VTDSYPSLPLGDAVEMQQRVQAGDDEARAFFDGLFRPEEEWDCFTCGGQLQLGGRVLSQIIGDPLDKSRALIVPICGGAKCGALPHLYLRHRVTKVAKAMWPNAGWWKATFVPRRKGSAA
jgi:hypothetical protein